MNVKPRFWSWLGACAVIFSFVWQQMQSVRLGYAVEDARRRTQTQRDQNAYLRLEMERLLSPASLARIANQRLHMRPPTPESLVVLDSEPSSLLSRYTRDGSRAVPAGKEKDVAARYTRDGSRAVPAGKEKDADRKFAVGAARKVLLLARGVATGL